MEQYLVDHIEWVVGAVVACVAYVVRLESAISMRKKEILQVCKDLNTFSSTTQDVVEKLTTATNNLEKVVTRLSTFIEIIKPGIRIQTEK